MWPSFLGLRVWVEYQRVSAEAKENDAMNTACVHMCF